VDHELDRPAVAAELGSDRVHEERHVVGDDFDHAVALGRPAVAFGDGVGDPDVGSALRTVAGKLAVGERGTDYVLVAPRDDVLGRDVAVVATEEGSGGRLVAGSAASGLLASLSSSAAFSSSSPTIVLSSSRVSADIVVVAPGPAVLVARGGPPVVS
jgi:hypothetical protein